MAVIGEQTFADLIVFVAEFLGLGAFDSAGNPLAPADGYALNLCRRIVNEGRKAFYTERPRWRFLRQRVSLTFDPTGASAQNGENLWTYRMPRWFTGVGTEPWVFESPKQYHGEIGYMGEEEIRRRHAIAQTSGVPLVFSYSKANQDGSPRERRAGWTAIFWPQPSIVHSISTQVRGGFYTMDHAEDVDVAGPDHEDTIKWACLKAAEFHRDKGAGSMAAAYAERLARSFEMDDATASKTVGPVTDGGRPLDFGQIRVKGGVTTWNGQKL